MRIKSKYKCRTEDCNKLVTIEGDLCYHCLYFGRGIRNISKVKPSGAEFKQYLNETRDKNKYNF